MSKWLYDVTQDRPQIRRFPVAGGYLYQIEKTRNSDYGNNEIHVGWNAPIFVAVLDSKPKSD